MQSEAEELKSQLAAADTMIATLSRALAESEARIGEAGPAETTSDTRVAAAPREGPTTEPGGETPAAFARADDETITAVGDLAKNEFCHGRPESAAAIARLILERIPNQFEAGRILSLVRPLERADGPPLRQRAPYHLALGDAYRMLGETGAAATHYNTALTFERDLANAQGGLAALRMPGPNYLYWLDRFYQILKPRSVIEIGVCQSASLARVQRPAIALGIDPLPSVAYPLQTQTHIFAETSDEFFGQRNVRTYLAAEPLSIGFIDGLHLFEQALRDFINLEKYCDAHSMVMFHDTIPFDELTQRRVPEVHFSTGDIWKTILCLKSCRPDLDIFTIATPPTGLTVVTGLDPASQILTNTYDDAVARFIDIPFSTIEDARETALNIVPNDWEFVEARLKARGVI